MVVQASESGKLGLPTAGYYAIRWNKKMSVMLIRSRWLKINRQPPTSMLVSGTRRHFLCWWLFHINLPSVVFLFFADIKKNQNMFIHKTFLCSTIYKYVINQHYRCREIWTAEILNGILMAVEMPSTSSIMVTGYRVHWFIVKSRGGIGLLPHACTCELLPKVSNEQWGWK